MTALPDAYEWRARIAPVLLACSPALALATTSVLQSSRALQTGSMLAAAVTLFLGQIGRDGGRRLQPGLWHSWGGSPTVVRLRANPKSPSASRRRSAVEQALSIQLPSAEQERDDPERADEHYADAVRQLRVRATRERAPMVWQENVSYGFRRNLLGLRPFGIVVAIVIGIVCAALIVLADQPGEQAATLAAPLVIAVAALLIQVVLVRPEWVRVPADAYADQLLDGIPMYAGSGSGTSSDGK